MREALSSNDPSAIASQEIKDAKALALSRYERYVPRLLSRSVAEFMARIDAAQASSVYAEFRNNGYDNDERSFARGMRVFLTTPVKNAWAKKERSATAFVPQSSGLWQREYSHGIFSDGMYGDDPEDLWLTIHEYVEQEYKGGEPYTFSRQESDSAFCTPHKNIVRIEGEMGEVWQNPKLGLDGSPKIVPAVAAKA